MSVPRPRGASASEWQYHSRSDHHSKVACWTVAVDLLGESALMRQHAQEGKIVLGVNLELRDFRTGRKKDLDLVIGKPAQDTPTTTRSLATLADEYGLELTAKERTWVKSLPHLSEGVVGPVMVALEAKAAMTEHSKARPRLYDELTSSFSTVLGNSSNALAVGLVMVNLADSFVSPDLNKGGKRRSVVSKHTQPKAAESILEKVRELPRRTGDQQQGFDGLAVLMVECRNDGTPIRLVVTPPAPQVGDVLNYRGMITRVAHEYDARFRNT
jgi:hypothetical protein